MLGKDKLIIQELLENGKELLETPEKTKTRIDKIFDPLDSAVKGLVKPDRVLEDVYGDYTRKQTAADRAELETRQTALATSNKALTKAKNAKRWYVGSAIFAAIVTSPLIVAVAAVAVAVGVVAAIPAAAIYVFVKSIPDTRTTAEKFSDKITNPIKNFFLGKILGKIKKAIWDDKLKGGYDKLNKAVSDAEVGVAAAEAQVRETEEKIKQTTVVIDREKKDLKQIIEEISKLEKNASKKDYILDLSAMGYIGDIGVELLCRSLERLSTRSPAPVWASLTLNLGKLSEAGRNRLADVIANLKSDNLEIKEIDLTGTEMTKELRQALETNLTITAVEYDRQKTSEDDILETTKQLVINRYLLKQPYDDLLKGLTPKQIKHIFAGDTPEEILASIKDASERKVKERMQKDLTRRYNCLQGHLGPLSQESFVKLKKELDSNFDLTFFDFDIERYKGVGKLSDDVKKYVKDICSRNQQHQLLELAKSFENRIVSDEEVGKLIKIIDDVSPENYYAIKSLLVDRVFPFLNEQSRSKVNEHLKQKRQGIPDVLSVFAEKFRYTAPTDADVTEFMEILAAMPQKSRQDAIEKAGKKGSFTSLIIQRYMTSQEPQELMIKLRDLNNTNPELLKAMLRYHLKNHKNPKDKTDWILELLSESEKYDEKILSEFINNAINTDKWKDITKKGLKEEWQSENKPSAQKAVVPEKLSEQVKQEPEPAHKLAVQPEELKSGEQVLQPKVQTTVSSTLGIVSALGIPPGAQQKPDFSKMADKELQEWLMKEFECLKPKFHATETDIIGLQKWMKENPYLKKFHHNLYPPGQRPSTKTCDLMDLWCQTNGSLKSYKDSKDSMNEFIRFFANTKHVKPDNYSKVLEEIGKRELGFLTAVQKYMGSEKVLMDLQKLAKENPKALEAMLRYNKNTEYNVQLVSGLLKLLEKVSSNPKSSEAAAINAMSVLVFNITSGAWKDKNPDELEKLISMAGMDLSKKPGILDSGIKADIAKVVYEAREKIDTSQRRIDKVVPRQI